MAFSAHSSEAFARYVERQVTEKKMTYMEAVLDFCEQRGIEPEAIVPYLNGKIKDKLGKEAQSLHLIPRQNELPLS